MINLTAIKQRLSGLSPAPWAVGIAGEGESRLLTVGDPNRIVCRLADVLTPWDTRLANATFIANARQDIETLLIPIELMASTMAANGELDEFDMTRPESLATTARDAMPAVEHAVDWLAEKLDADVHAIRAATIQRMDAGTDDEWLQAIWSAVMFQEGADGVSWAQLGDLRRELWILSGQKLSFIDVDIMADADGLLLNFTMAAAVQSAGRPAQEAPHA